MAAIKQFSFNVTLESWAFTVGGATTLAGTRDTTEDAPNDSNSGTGLMQARRTGKNRTDGTPYWEWAGTWQDLGVPAGATVTQVNLDYDWRCSEYTTGASTSATGPAELRDGAGTTLRGTFSAALTFGATGSFATRSGSAVTGLADASSTAIRLRLAAKPDTGNSTSAAVTLRQDWVVVTITYTQTYAYSASGGAQSGAGADVAKTKAYPSSGGLQSGGAATTQFVSSTNIYTYVGSGGVTVGGAADLAKTKDFVASGGGQSAGQAGTAKTKAFVASGGGLGAGQAALAITKAFTASGGGSLAGGTAGLAKTKAFAAAGGGQAGGVAEVSKTKAFTASGGTQGGGSSLTQYIEYIGAGATVYTYIMSGGMITGGGGLFAKTDIGPVVITTDRVINSIPSFVVRQLS